MRESVSFWDGTNDWESIIDEKDESFSQHVTSKFWGLSAL
jgi:hypothetical protein